MHHVEAFVDFVERQDMRDHRVDLDRAVHIEVDDLWDIGATLSAAERGAAPVAAGDELERRRADLLARLSHADDDAGTPAAVAGLKRLTHDGRVAGAIEGIFSTAIGQRNELRDDIAVDVVGIDEMRHAELLAP